VSDTHSQMNEGAGVFGAEGESGESVRL